MTLDIDITAEQFAIVSDILERYLPPGATVWAFGSRATHTAKKSSDLDLVVDHQGTPLTLFEESVLKEAFDNSLLPFKVDIVDWSSISDSFKQLIQGQRIRIFSKGIIS